jgi:hypothetical protein
VSVVKHMKALISDLSRWNDHDRLFRNLFCILCVLIQSDGCTREGALLKLGVKFKLLIHGAPKRRNLLGRVESLFYVV